MMELRHFEPEGYKGPLGEPSVPNDAGWSSGAWSGQPQRPLPGRIKIGLDSCVDPDTLIIRHRRANCDNTSPATVLCITKQSLPSAAVFLIRWEPARLFVLGEGFSDRPEHKRSGQGRLRAGRKREWKPAQGIAFPGRLPEPKTSRQRSVAAPGSPDLDFREGPSGCAAQGIPTVVVVVRLSTAVGAAATVVVVVEEVSDGASTAGVVPLSLV
jgi:hypothetical protein